ncbi:MAG: DeoR/GlpR family DNA-binding transcription regulator [Bacteroidales bacterium]|nr:DeoR/GlpR family DNA-binding transcription regulator [Bacteroidales bacterium]MCF8391690.1 DeoR/GlpR family DNA-binding transcription regulator [Bacteroidales bacterium]
MENRHNRILEILKEKKRVKVQDLSTELETSMVTIRKDLKILEGKRLLYRNHGGASLDSPYVNDRSVSEKEFINASEKAAIGLQASKLIHDDQYIILASGTTVLAMTEFINPLKKLTVVTSALNVALKLTHRDNIEVLQLGGYIRQNSVSVIGHYSENILKETVCSKLFLGVDGLDLEYGLTTSNGLEAHLNQQMIQSSKEVIVLADSTKFGKKSFGRICGIEQVDRIITDSKIDPDIVMKIKSLGITIDICD